MPRLRFDERVLLMMRGRRGVLPLVLAGLVAIGGVACGKSTPAPSATSGAPPKALGVVLTDKDDGHTVEATTGQIVAVKLESNATTGFSWGLNVDPDGAVLKALDNKYVPPAEAIPGAGGTELWLFQAVGPGTTTIDMGYYPPGSDGSGKPGQSFSVTVNVTEG